MGKNSLKREVITLFENVRGDNLGTIIFIVVEYNFFTMSHVNSGLG